MFDYKLVRAKRKTLAISVRDGEVTVKAPIRMSLEHINSFVAEKSKWIEKKLADFERKDAVFSPVINGDAVMIGGEICPIAITDECKRIKFENGRLLVPVKYEEADAQKRAISSWYRRTAAEVLRHKLEQYSIATGLKYADFATTNARTKWGSCDGNGNIRLNWRLIMLDDGLTEYVIIHELSHTVHHDHSAAFWSEVEKHCKNYKSERTRLKTYSVLTSLYR